MTESAGVPAVVRSSAFRSVAAAATRFVIPGTGRAASGIVVVDVMCGAA